MHISASRGEITLVGELIFCLTSNNGEGIFITDGVNYAGQILTANDIVRVRGRFCLSIAGWGRLHSVGLTDYLRTVSKDCVTLDWYRIDDETMEGVHRYMCELW
jgi:hypothetical protein